MHHWSWGNHARKGNLAVINGRKIPKTTTNHDGGKPNFKKKNQHLRPLNKSSVGPHLSNLFTGPIASPIDDLTYTVC